MRADHYCSNTCNPETGEWCWAFCHKEQPSPAPTTAPTECPAREKYDCSSSLIAVSRVASCLLQHCFEGGGENCAANCDYNCDGEGNSGDLKACLSDYISH